MDDQKFDLIMIKLSEVTQDLNRLEDKVSSIQLDLERLKTEFKIKASIFGVVFGFVASIIYSLIKK